GLDDVVDELGAVALAGLRLFLEDEAVFGGGQQLEPVLALDAGLVGAAGGQDDLDALGGAAYGADGDVVQVGGIDAAFQRGGEVLDLEGVAGLGRHLALVHLVDEDGAADQIDAEDEAALALVVLAEGVGDDADGDQRRDQTDEDAEEEPFHDTSSCL